MGEGLSAAESSIPVNSQASEGDIDAIYRALDNAVFTWLHNARASQQPPLPPSQAVRAAFHQGVKIAPTSGFHASTHIQIALRDNSCVLGWFLPAGAELLTEQQYTEAKVRFRVAMAANGKPHIRARYTS
jgi:hypothetical protein